MVVREEERASRMSGEGLGLGRARKNKMILGVLNVEGVEAAMTRLWVGTPSQFDIYHLRTDVVMHDSTLVSCYRLL